MSNSTISDSKLKEYHDVALDLVHKCGPILMKGFTEPKTDYKIKDEFWNFLTVYDKQIEDTLMEGLKAAFPESLFIGEEELTAANRQAELTDAPTWIIDPIDGTTNFIHRIPHCCISVGLAINKELVVGIIYNPPANEMFSAWKGHGAYLNGQRINSSKITTMNAAVIAHEISLINSSDTRDKNVKRIYKLGSKAAGTRSFGCAALSLCYVATGQCDAYHIDDLQPWDIAAGAVIVTEAGGCIYHTKGGKFNVMKPDLVCAATEELVKQVIDLIEEANQMTGTTFE
ncbi:hypothetical protein ACLKA7_015633 [Drosophila subpalustris]